MKSQPILERAHLSKAVLVPLNGLQMQKEQPRNKWRSVRDKRQIKWKKENELLWHRHTLICQCSKKGIFGMRLIIRNFKELWSVFPYGVFFPLAKGWLGSNSPWQPCFSLVINLSMLLETKLMYSVTSISNNNNNNKRLAAYILVLNMIRCITQTSQSLSSHL